MKLSDNHVNTKLYSYCVILTGQAYNISRSELGGDFMLSLPSYTGSDRVFELQIYDFEKYLDVGNPGGVVI